MWMGRCHGQFSVQRRQRRALLVRRRRLDSARKDKLFSDERRSDDTDVFSNLFLRTPESADLLVVGKLRGFATRSTSLLVGYIQVASSARPARSPSQRTRAFHRTKLLWLLKISRYGVTLPLVTLTFANQSVNSLPTLLLCHHDEPNYQVPDPRFGGHLLCGCLCPSCILCPTSNFSNGSCRCWQWSSLWQDRQGRWSIPCCHRLLHDVVRTLQSYCPQVWRNEWKVPQGCLSQGKTRRLTTMGILLFFLKYRRTPRVCASSGSASHLHLCVCVYFYFFRC